MTTMSWTVGKVAQRSGIAVSALHFYEKKGLIRSTRNAGNQRRYNPDVLRRVALIKAAQSLGISLKEIQQAFSSLPNGRTATQKDWEKLSKHWQADLNARIAYMERMRDYLTGCIGCGCLSMNKCPLYNEADKLAAHGPGAVVLENKHHAEN